MKTALITGGARGIGLATAKGLLSEGWQVAILDSDSDALADALTNLPGVIGLDADVSVPEDVNRAVGEVTEAFARLDGLVKIYGD